MSEESAGFEMSSISTKQLLWKWVSQKNPIKYLSKQRTVFLKFARVSPLIPVLNKWSYVLYQRESANFHSSGKIKQLMAVHFCRRKKKEIFKLVWESYRLQCLNIVLKTETNYLVEKKKKMNQGLTFLPVHLAEKNSRSEFLKSWNCMNCLLFTVCSLYWDIRCLV